VQGSNLKTNLILWNALARFCCKQRTSGISFRRRAHEMPTHVPRWNSDNRKLRYNRWTQAKHERLPFRLTSRINKNDGSCQGTQYSDPYGTWDNVIVDAIVRINLRSSYVPVHLSTGRIMLKSGTICELINGFCIDYEDGHTFWKPMPTSSCNFHQYDVLYEGLATKITTETANSPTIYTLTTEDITFALTKTKEQPLCGYTLLRTEHPKLFILETRKGNTFAARGSIPVNNLDIFTYVNSKFVYVEKHIR